MKHTKNMYINPSHEATELELYALHSNPAIYRRLLGVVETLRRHVKRGNYDPARAVDAFYYTMNDAAKMYAREFMSIGAGFTVTERYTAAAAMVEHFEEDILD